MGQEGESSRGDEVGESSQAAERRRRPFVQLEPEPLDDMDPEKDMQGLLELWPIVEQHVLAEEWHPCRLVFDEKDRLILPSGPAHPMYGFLNRARYEVQQYDLHHPDVQPLITWPAPGRGGPRGQRPALNFQLLNQQFQQRDPRIQNLLSQVESTPEGNTLSRRKHQWREVIRFRKKEVSLAQLHARAAAIGITPGHRQRPASSDFEWPDHVPVRIETNLPALEGPPIRRRRRIIVESQNPGRKLRTQLQTYLQVSKQTHHLNCWWKKSQLTLPQGQCSQLPQQIQLLYRPPALRIPSLR